VIWEAIVGLKHDTVWVVTLLSKRRSGVFLEKMLATIFS